MSDLDSNLGKIIPLEFIQNLADCALWTARDYLKANNAPEQVIELYDQAVMLARFEEMKKYNHGEEIYDSLFTTIPYVLENITALGSDLSNSECNYKREPIAWGAIKQE